MGDLEWHNRQPAANIRPRNRIVELQSGYADYQILKWNRDAPTLRLAVNPGRTARDLKRQGINRHCIKQVVKELLPAPHSGDAWRQSGYQVRTNLRPHLGQIGSPVSAVEISSYGHS
jgi:hypothetical protein